ncbi:MAG: NeuD/PglB/VioB family sugar acetyltransferase [Chloroflexota bacterium]
MNTITIPLLNPNEPEALLAAIHVEEGQQVAAGDILCTLETTKSTADLEAEADGYLIGLQNDQGDTVRAGDILGYLADSPDAEVPEIQAVELHPDSKPAVPDGLRISKPALALAQENNLDLSDFPSGPIITEQDVRSRLRAAAPITLPDTTFDPTSMIIYGSGGHGKSVLDLLRMLGTYDIVGFIDDGMPPGDSVMGLPVLGGEQVLEELHQKGVQLCVNAVGGIGNIKVRVKVFQRLTEAGYTCPAVVHPTAFVEPSAVLSPGVQVFPHAYVGSEVNVGFGSIINTGAIVSHDCQLDDYANISPGAVLAGGVKIGLEVLVGMGVTVNLGVEIGAGARVGNSAVVKDDVPVNGIVPAGTMWPRP